MSYGCYREENERLFPAGLWHGAAAPWISRPLRKTSRMRGTPPPACRNILPQAARCGSGKGGCLLLVQGTASGRAGSGNRCLARQVVAGHPLARDMIEGYGASVAARVVARLLELRWCCPPWNAG